MHWIGTARMFICPVLAACISFAVHAQSVSRSTDTSGSTVHQIYEHPKPKPPKPIGHEASGGIRLNTDGWSVFCDLGKVKSKDKRHSDMFYDTRIWQFEFGEKYAPGEEKTTVNNGAGTSSYKYGKINNFYTLKVAYGYRSLLVGKPDPGSVSIHWVNAGGVALGLLKPYYLNVYSDPSAIGYSPSTSTEFLDQDVIEGSAGFSKGLDQTKFVPGIHLKSALHFDFSANRKTVLAVEAGVNFEYYSQAIQIMANQSGAPYFLEAYISGQFGKRW